MIADRIVLDARIRMVGQDKRHLPWVDPAALHLQELVLGFLRCNTVNGETMLDAVHHESGRVIEVSANLAIDLDVMLQILVTSVLVKTYFTMVAQKNTSGRQRVTQFVWASGCKRGKGNPGGVQSLFNTFSVREPS